MKDKNIIKDLRHLRKDLRKAIANYIATEGCSCCRDTDGHDSSLSVIANLLNVPKYSDGSGYNFDKYETIYKKQNS